MSEIVKKKQTNHLSHTEFCAREVRGPQIVQTFLWRIKLLTEEFVVLDKHRTLNINIILKNCTCFQYV